jgi:hypothetical protein
MRFSFRPQLEEMDARIVPATTVPTLGHSAVFVALTATQETTQLAIAVPSGNTVQTPPQPVTPSAVEQAVIAFETTHGVPPNPVNPGLLVAAGFITPSAGL